MPGWATPAHRITGGTRTIRWTGRRWRTATEAAPGVTIASSLIRVQFNDHIPGVLDAYNRVLQDWPGVPSASSQLEEKIQIMELVTLASSVLDREDLSGPARLEFSDLVQRGVSSLREMLNDFMSLARLDAARSSSRHPDTELVTTRLPLSNTVNDRSCILSKQWGFTPWRGLAGVRRISLSIEMHAPQQTNNTNTVNTDIHPETPMSQLPEAAREIARRAADAANETAQRATGAAKDATGIVQEVAGDVADATKDAAKRATDTAKEMYQSAALKAGDALATSKEYVRRNPVPVVLGAIGFGAAIGYLLMMARRKPTFSERYADEALVAVREAIRGALAPVTQRVHKGYHSAREGAGKAMDQVQRFGAGRTANSLSDQIGRFGNNLKFW